MPVQMSANPKRIRNFIINGKVYEGGIEQLLGGAQHNLGGAGIPNGISTPDGEIKKD